MQAVFKTVTLETRAAEVDPDQPLKFVASTEAVDRYGDIVRADGWDLTNFKKNPIALFSHRGDSPIGVNKVWLEGKQLMTEMTLAAKGTGPVVDYVRELVRQRILRAVSVGFMPLEEPKYLRDEKNDYITGLEYTKQELLEISLVSVPANPQAVSVARSFGLDPVTHPQLFRPVSRNMTAKQARLDFLRLSGAI